jgi:hypothetical protein
MARYGRFWNMLMAAIALETAGGKFFLYNLLYIFALFLALPVA